MVVKVIYFKYTTSLRIPRSNGLSNALPPRKKSPIKNERGELEVVTEIMVILG